MKAITYIKIISERLLIEDWSSILGEPSKRGQFERELKVILTPKVTQYLPHSMQFSADQDSITKWTTDLAAEAQVLCVHRRDTVGLVGLIILADDPVVDAIPTHHLGYFLGESDWGNGFATEILKELLAEFENGDPVKLVAGVDRGNIASAKVLEKSGFTKIPDQSISGQNFFEYVVG